MVVNGAIDYFWRLPFAFQILMYVSMEALFLAQWQLPLLQPFDFRVQLSL